MHVFVLYVFNCSADALCVLFVFCFFLFFCLYCCAVSLLARSAVNVRLCVTACAAALRDVGVAHEGLVLVHAEHAHALLYLPLTPGGTL